MGDPVSSQSIDEWEATLARRVAEIRNGTAVGRDFDEVMAELEGLFPDAAKDDCDS